MKKSKLDNPHIKQEVVKRIAIGESQRSISKDVGLNQSQISRFVRREDVKGFIEEEQIKLVEVVPDAVENIKELVREMKEIPKKDIKRRELSLKASMETLKAVGIMSSHVQSQVITNIYHQTNYFQNPLLQEVLHRHLKSLMNIDTNDEEKDKENEP